MFEPFLSSSPLSLELTVVVELSPIVVVSSTAVVVISLAGVVVMSSIALEVSGFGDNVETLSEDFSWIFDESFNISA